MWLGGEKPEASPVALLRTRPRKKYWPTEPGVKFACRTVTPVRNAWNEVSPGRLIWTSNT